MTVEPILGSVWGPGNPVTFAKGGPDPLLMHSRPADGRGGQRRARRGLPSAQVTAHAHIASREMVGRRELQRQGRGQGDRSRDYEREKDYSSPVTSSHTFDMHAPRPLSFLVGVLLEICRAFRAGHRPAAGPSRRCRCRGNRRTGVPGSPNRDAAGLRAARPCHPTVCACCERAKGKNHADAPDVGTSGGAAARPPQVCSLCRPRRATGVPVILAVADALRSAVPPVPRARSTPITHAVAST